MKSSPEKTGFSTLFREAVVSALFLGRSPVAPGTAGTLGGVAIAVALPGENFTLWVAAIVVALLALGFTLAPWAEAHYGRKDPPRFVLDEVIGYLLAVIAAKPSWSAATLAFFLFRFFDVWKPWPCRRLEAIPGGGGILLDDVAAGIYAFACLSAARALFPEI